MNTDTEQTNEPEYFSICRKYIVYVLNVKCMRKLNVFSPRFIISTVQSCLKDDKIHELKTKLTRGRSELYGLSTLWRLQHYLQV